MKDGMPENPYVGPRPYKVEEHDLLFGRRWEIQDLRNLVIANRAVLFYSPSGAGKTSLIQAGLIPLLQGAVPHPDGLEEFPEEDKYPVVPAPIRAGLAIPNDLYQANKQLNRYCVSTLLSLGNLLGVNYSGEQLKRPLLENLLLLALADGRRPSQAKPLTVIFDQFEEILTLDPTDLAAKAEFFRQLGAVLESGSFRVLFAMREDHIAALTSYLRYLPDRMETRFRLDFLREETALDAIIEPARSQGVTFMPDAARKLIDDLRLMRVQDATGAAIDRPGPFVEPVQLQVVCWTLWRAQREDPDRITVADIEAAGAGASGTSTVQQALMRYYDGRIEEIVRQTRTDEARLRRWLEDVLINEQNLRGQVIRGTEETLGLKNSIVQLLIDAYLVRVEERRGVVWLELAHDRLIGPIQTSNQTWRAARERSRSDTPSASRGAASTITEPDLELNLRPLGGERYSVDLVYGQPESEAAIRPLTSVIPVQLDFAELHSLTLDPVNYGRTLTRMLFSDPNLAATVAQARAVARNQDRAMRLRLAIDPGVSELHTLRWETMRDPSDDQPFALSQGLLLSRAVTSANWVPVRLRSKAELQALVLIAAPASQPNYGVEPYDNSIRDRILAALRTIKTTVLTGPGQGTLELLKTELRKGCDILYLVAAGVMVDGEPWLLLDNGLGEVARVSAAVLVELLANLDQPPRVALLELVSNSNISGLALMLSPRIAAAGIAAVVALPEPLSVETMERFTSILFDELLRDGRVDRALTMARQAIAERPDWWAPVLFTRLRSGRIWYEAGFAAEDFSAWPALIQAIRTQKSTPILGPGLLEALTGSPRDLARRLAERYGFPLRPADRDDLARVTQFLAVAQDVSFIYYALAKELAGVIGERSEVSSDSADSFDEASELLRAAGTRRRAADPYEPHRVLAQLPLPVFVTFNSDDLLADALREAGKEPKVVVCSWYEEKWVDHSESERPTPEKPLVFHLFGHTSDPKSLVITEDDYLSLFAAVMRDRKLLPIEVQRSLADSSLLLLGFDIDNRSLGLIRQLIDAVGSARRARYTHVIAYIEPQEGAVINPQAAHDYLRMYWDWERAIRAKVYWGSAEDFARELMERYTAKRRD
jgi:hypothetical protein